MLEKSGSGAGFSNWQEAARRYGNKALASVLERMDPGDMPNGVNAHTAIAERLKLLNLPIQTYISLPAGEFLHDPAAHLARISQGDYYFASIKPGLHIANTKNMDEVIDFVREFVMADPSPKNLAKEVYISHNGMPTMSGHIIVDKDETPNNINAEFTIGNFNLFHRGFQTPEITVRRRDRRFVWGFRGALATEDDWRNEDEQFVCNGGPKLSRPEMARRIYGAISRIPHDGDRYLPGYYEVLLENVDGYATRPAFIDAVRL